MFQGYVQPIGGNYKDVVVNIIGFIPIGLLAVQILEKHQIFKAMLVGLLVSLAIECSQLIWKRGTFDVDDLFNNTLGVLIGGLLVILVIGIRKLVNKKEQSVL